jgi:hypothetical protein
VLSSWMTFQNGWNVGQQMLRWIERRIKMADTATRVSSKFRKDVEKVSKDKVGGYIVRHFREVFAPDAVATIRSKGPQKIGPTGHYVVLGRPTAKKAKKK